MLSKYPQTQSYLEKSLGLGKQQKWAICYTSQIFNLGLNSSQAAESVNAKLKSLKKNTLIRDLFNTLEAISIKENLELCETWRKNRILENQFFSHLLFDLYGPILKHFQKFLSAYAFSHIVNQMHSAAFTYKLEKQRVFMSISPRNLKRNSSNAAK